MLKNRIQACRTRHVSRGWREEGRIEKKILWREGKESGERRESRVARKTVERDSEKREGN